MRTRNHGDRKGARGEAVIYVAVSLLLPLVAGLVTCPDSITVCPNRNTCCPFSKAGGGTAYGCAPLEAGLPASCCAAGPVRASSDGVWPLVTACGVQYQCSDDTNRPCTNNSIPPEMPEEDWPVPAGMAGWELDYSLCQLPRELSKPVMIEMRDGLFFPYYSSVGEVSEGKTWEDIKLVLISQHGAARNADDYFCSAIEAARAQGIHKPEEIAVISPWFTTHADVPGPDVLWWNNTSVEGYWRAGADSDVRADQAGKGRTVSSFEVLDRLMENLVNPAKFPNLKMITLAGHSAGGQIMQRYAVFTSIPVTIRVPHLRFLPANPSSFLYFDQKRLIDGVFQKPSATQVKECPDFDAFQFGLSSGLPPYLARVNLDRAIYDYQLRDVVYVQGHNDTCNENVIPGCHSHGLETTCADMFEGRYRRERGEWYHRYLQFYYQTTDRRPVHAVRFVENVGHDHAQVYQGTLDLMFTIPPHIADAKHTLLESDRHTTYLAFPRGSVIFMGVVAVLFVGAVVCWLGCCKSVGAENQPACIYLFSPDNKLYSLIQARPANTMPEEACVHLSNRPAPALSQLKQGPVSYAPV